MVVDGERVGIRERISKLIAHLSASDHLAFYCDLASSSISSCSLPLFYYIGPSMPNLQLGGCNSSTATTRVIMYMDGERKGEGETTRRSFDFDFVTNQYWPGEQQQHKTDDHHPSTRPHSRQCHFITDDDLWGGWSNWIGLNWTWSRGRFNKGQSKGIVTLGKKRITHLLISDDDFCILKWCT